jgi:ATP adenylyltransferase
MHVIPRYKNELGFIDIIGGSKIIVEDPALTMQKLKKSFEKW